MTLSRLRHWLMAVMVGLLAACDNNPFPHVKPGTDQYPVAQPKDSQGRTYVIGNLGGKPINIPYGAINTWVRYEGDPGDFDTGGDAKNYKRPPITYDLPIESFGFQYRIADGAIRMKGEPTEQEYIRDNARYVPKGEPLPWAWVIVYGVNDPKQALNFNWWVNDTVQDTWVTNPANRQKLSVNYQQEPSPVEGLIYYQANKGIDPTTGTPWKSDVLAEDLFIRKDAQGNIKTYIKCSFTGKVKQCDHYHYLTDMRVKIYALYNRHYLPQWQSIESGIEKILHSWVVQHPDKSLKQQVPKPQVVIPGA